MRSDTPRTNVWWRSARSARAVMFKWATRVGAAAARLDAGCWSRRFRRWCSRSWSNRPLHLTAPAPARAVAFCAVVSWARVPQVSGER